MKSSINSSKINLMPNNSNKISHIWYVCTTYYTTTTMLVLEYIV